MRTEVLAFRKKLAKATRAGASRDVLFDLYREGIRLTTRADGEDWWKLRCFVGLEALKLGADERNYAIDVLEAALDDLGVTSGEPSITFHSLLAELYEQAGPRYLKLVLSHNRAVVEDEASTDVQLSETYEHLGMVYGRGRTDNDMSHTSLQLMAYFQAARFAPTREMSELNLNRLLNVAKTVEWKNRSLIPGLGLSDAHFGSTEDLIIDVLGQPSRTYETKNMRNFDYDGNLVCKFDRHRADLLTEVESTALSLNGEDLVNWEALIPEYERSTVSRNADALAFDWSEGRVAGVCIRALVDPESRRLEEY